MTIFVTDHAVLRWLERSAGLDIEAIRGALASNAADVAASIHCDTVILPNGCRLKMCGAVVVTCLPKPRRKRCKSGNRQLRSGSGLCLDKQ